MYGQEPHRAVEKVSNKNIDRAGNENILLGIPKGLSTSRVSQRGHVRPK